MLPPTRLRVERSDRIATVVIDRQEALNALDTQLLRDLGSAFEQLEGDEEVGGVLITGAGEEAFAAGADLRELAGATPETAGELSRLGQEVLRRIELFPKPVVAEVRGYALGGGCELALACHLRVASEDAHFGLPETGLGLLPGFGGTVRLARVVGLGRALELILTGEMVDARRAREMGLVTRVVARSDVRDEARRLLSKVLENGPLALRGALESVYHALDSTVEGGLRHERALFALLAGTDDAHEGVAAFREKRRPQFRGK